MKLISCFLLCAIAFAVTSSSVAAPKRPNIVAILTDDQGYADISLNPRHSPKVSTPNMDASAKDRNKERINDEGYLTTRLTEEAVAFIDRNKEKPFFLYLAYNAVHALAEAPGVDIKAFQAKFPELSKERAILMATLKHLDDGVGEVVGKLKREGIFNDTLLFFLTDNGGSKAMSADNTPLRGFKQTLDEGGIRTPFLVS